MIPFGKIFPVPWFVTVECDWAEVLLGEIILSSTGCGSRGDRAVVPFGEIFPVLQDVTVGMIALWLFLER